MTDKKIIAVVGATGAQGGGVARAMSESPRGRNPEPASKMITCS